MQLQFYTKKQAEKLVRQINKTPVTTVDGVTSCTVAEAFCYKRGHYLILTDTAYTNAFTLRTEYKMSFLGASFTGDSQEQCYLKIIAYLLSHCLSKSEVNK